MIKIAATVFFLLFSTACFAGNYKAENISIKTIEQNGDRVKYAIKADVTNLGTRDTVAITLQGVDSDGFEVDSVILTGNIPPSGTKVLTDTETMPAKDFSRIKKWQFKD